MTLTLTVHRGTQQIGGSCIELSARNGERLILDAGRPLDSPREDPVPLPDSLDLMTPAQVVISHPHMDHWGLLPALPTAWPIWTGEKSAKLIRLTSELFGEPLARPLSTWHSRSGPVTIGAFSVTPFLTDHSALDAYMLLIEHGGTRVLYTGDFRTHGRKSALVEGMITSPPTGIDVLLMEGTNLKSSKPVVSEREVEERFLALALETQGHIFVEWSAQNFDRTVSLFRVARRSGRLLAIDLYTADALMRVAEGTGLPCPVANGFDELRVLFTPAMAWLYERKGRQDFLEAMKRTGKATSRARIADTPSIIMTRKGLLRDFERGDHLTITERDAYVHSNWRGYLDEDDERSGWVRAGKAGARREMIHTSGHASATDLARFAGAMAPHWLVPVHGVEWDEPGIALPPVRRLDDGEAWNIPTS